jgi:putative nucleotidyltransferase with HDIG domain
MDLEEKFIQNIDNLVPRPDIALEVMSLAHSQTLDIKKLSATIEQDPSLTANMLHLANSAYFGHMKQINSITDIIVRLGIDTVKMLAITGAAVGFLKTPQDAYNLEPGALWKHSYATALLASIIGKYAKSANISVLYSAALLHDIGKIVLNRDLQRKCLEQNTYWDGNDISGFEERMLGTNHTKIAVALLKKWGLPETITRLVACHHDPNTLSADDVDGRVVYLANSLAENIGISAVEPEECVGTLKNSDLDAELLSVPGLQENIENIIEEFFNKFNNQY